MNYFENEYEEGDGELSDNKEEILIDNFVMEYKKYFKKNQYPFNSTI